MESIKARDGRGGARTCREQQHIPLDASDIERLASDVRHVFCPGKVPARAPTTPPQSPDHPGVELRANLESTSHRCYLEEVAFVWELTKETIVLPLVCLQGG